MTTPPDRRFGPDPATCHLCANSTCLGFDGNLCLEWLRARSQNMNPARVWHFNEYEPGKFVLYANNRSVALLTHHWSEVLTFYRNRPEYIPPARPMQTAAAPKGLLAKVEIKL